MPRPPPLSMAQSRGAGEAAGQGRATAGHATEEKVPEAGREDNGVTREWAERAGRHRGRKEIESQKRTDRASAEEKSELYLVSFPNETLKAVAARTHTYTHRRNSHVRTSTVTGPGTS